MKRFYIFILTLFSFVSFLSLVSDYFISSQLRKSKKGDFGVWNDLINGKCQSDILVYGSSRAWVHINPKSIEDTLGLTCYNLGMDGYGVSMQYARGQVYESHQKLPKYILYSLDIFTLNKRADLYNEKQFLPYLNDKQIRSITKEYKGLSFYDYSLPFVRYFGNFGSIVNSFTTFFNPQQNQYDRYKGFQGRNANWNNQLEKEALKNPYFEAIIDSTSYQLLERFIVETQQKNVSLIFVYTPEYIGGQKFTRNRNTIMSIFKQLSDKYHLPFLDYSGMSICSTKNYFYNAQHLNNSGALLFSKQLAHDLKKIVNSKYE
jgi:hypothetical protein